MSAQIRSWIWGSPKYRGACSHVQSTACVWPLYYTVLIVSNCVYIALEHLARSVIKSILGNAFPTLQIKLFKLVVRQSVEQHVVLLQAIPLGC